MWWAHEALFVVVVCAARRRQYRFSTNTFLAGSLPSFALYALCAVCVSVYCRCCGNCSFVCYSYGLLLLVRLLCLIFTAFKNTIRQWQCIFAFSRSTDSGQWPFASCSLQRGPYDERSPDISHLSVSLSARLGERVRKHFLCVAAPAPAHIQALCVYTHLCLCSAFLSSARCVFVAVFGFVLLLLLPCVWYGIVCGVCVGVSRHSIIWKQRTLAACVRQMLEWQKTAQFASHLFIIVDHRRKLGIRFFFLLACFSWLTILTTLQRWLFLPLSQL